MGFAIRAFVGPNGGGKSLAMIERMVLPSWREGRVVVSNMSLRPSALGFPDHLHVPIDRDEPTEHIKSLRHATLCIDEITTFLSSRSFNRVPVELVVLLHQLRKPDVEVAWTGVSWSRADVILREATQVVTTCRGTVADPFKRHDPPGTSAWFPPKLLDDEGRPIRHRSAWMPNRLFTWTSFDAFAFDEFTFTESARMKPLSRRRGWLYRLEARHAYDTLEGVRLMGHQARDAGLAPEAPAARPEPVAPRLRPGDSTNPRRIMAAG